MGMRTKTNSTTVLGEWRDGVIDKVAKDLKLGIIDLHAALKGKDGMIPDNVHPNNDGAAAIALAVFNVLTGKPALHK